MYVTNIVTFQKLTSTLNSVFDLIILATARMPLCLQFKYTLHIVVDPQNITCYFILLFLHN